MAAIMQQRLDCPAMQRRHLLTLAPASGRWRV